jgi:hypothetical protein
VRAHHSYQVKARAVPTSNAALMAFPWLFRIFYSTSFTILNIILLGLILITPGDAIRQALDNNQVYYVFVIAGCYFLTLVLAIFIYVSRLFTTRSVLAGIPKTWIQVSKSHIGKRVGKMITDSLARSSLIAWDSRPRLSNHKIADAPVLGTGHMEKKDFGLRDARRILLKRRLPDKEESPLPTASYLPAWDAIAHGGWSSPFSLDIPNLQFISVILELPHLIEAKAVSLAPQDPKSSASPPLPDLRAVELLQRPLTMGLRDYVDYLTSIGVLSPLESVTLFLSSYEMARFSSRPLGEDEFRALMRLFSEILRSMVSLDPAMIETFDEEESDIDGDATSTTTSESQRSRSIIPSYGSRTRSSSEETIRTGLSRRGVGSNTMARPLKLNTAPTTPRGKYRERMRGRSPSLHSFAQTKQPHLASKASSISLRSGSSGSVIKLSHSTEPGALPYTINTTPPL